MGAPVPILFIIHSLGHGGMERQVGMLCRNLARTRFEPHVATVLEGFRADELRREGIPIIHIPIQNFFRPGPFVLSGQLRAYIRQHSIRLVHLFDAGLSVVTVLSTIGMEAKLLTSQRFFMEVQKPLYRFLLLSAHWCATAVVANSEATKRSLHPYRYPLQRVEVCYNGIDTSVFRPEPRERLEPLKDAPLVIGCVCVLRVEKNLGILLRAFSRVKELVPGSKLLLMGSGPEKEKLDALAAELGIDKACVFLPSGADVTPALHSIDIFVHPSLSESLPNGVMEAMACGCCVVSTSVGGCPELIQDGVHGLLVAPGEEDELVEKLRKVMVEPEWRQKMASAAAERIAREFSVEASIRQMEAIYSRHLGS
jgi:L-malate glycosyltransferase